MNIISDFKFELNKDRVIRAVQSYCEMPQYEELSKMYDDLVPILREYSQPIGAFKLDKKPADLKVDLLKNCKFTVYCLVTIGEECTNKIDELFEEGKFYEAILLDSMSSSYLFSISSQLYHRIYERAKNMTLGLTCKIAPGDGEIGLEYQSKIVNKLKNDAMHNIKMLNSCMIYPYKSMSYIYGADECIAFNEEDHCCSNCSNTFCSMRDVNNHNNKPLLKSIDCA